MRKGDRKRSLFLIYHFKNSFSWLDNTYFHAYYQDRNIWRAWCLTPSIIILSLRGLWRNAISQQSSTAFTNKNNRQCLLTFWWSLSRISLPKPISRTAKVFFPPPPPPPASFCGLWLHLINFDIIAVHDSCNHYGILGILHTHPHCCDILVAFYHWSRVKLVYTGWSCQSIFPSFLVLPFQQAIPEPGTWDYITEHRARLSVVVSALLV